MRKNQILGIMTVAILILTIETPLGTLMSAEPEKVVFKRIWGYTPPPVGHWNIFMPNSISLASTVQESLTHRFAANDTYLPGLAVNWTYEDYSVFTLKLRKDAKWHDGTEFTSLDVWATWHCLYLMKDRAWYYLKNITIIDSNTLVFYMKERNDYCPFYILWHWVCVPYSQYGVLASRVYAKILEGYDISKDSTPYNALMDELKNFRPSVPIGTGPYKFKSISETEIVLEKFNDFWGGVPNIDEVRLMRVTDANVQWSMLSQGEFDWHWAIPTKEQHQLLVGKPWVKIVPVARQNGAAMYINSKIYPLSEQKVRQAMAYAINRTEIAFIKYPAGGSVQKYNTGFNDVNLVATLNASFITKYLDPLLYEYNPSKGEQLLKDLGYTKDTDGIYKTPNGTRLDFEFKSCTGGWLLGPEIEAIAAQLAKIGIKITPRLVDYGAYFANDGDFYQGRYQIGAAVYDGVDFSFDEYYHKYMGLGAGGLFPGHGFGTMQSVPWLTAPVNVTDLTIKMQTYPAGCSLTERNEIRAILSYITQNQVPVLTICSPIAYMYMNVDKFSGWPAEDDIYWRGLGTYEAHGSSYLHRWLLLKPNFYLLVSATPAGGGTISPAAGTIKYAKGTGVSVSATPASGFTFKNWMLDGASVSGATITVMMNMNHTLTAQFEAKPNLTLSVTSGGTTNPAAGTIPYAKGDQVTVTATPASGYNFKNWVLDGASVSGTSITVTMDTSHTLEAVFEAQQGLTISVSPSGGGTTNPAAGTIPYAKGDQVTVTATPASGYNFKNWVLDGASVSGTSITVTMDTSHTLEAVFAAIAPDYTLYIAGIAVVVVVAVVAYMMLRRKPSSTS